jgi:protein-L-isoaspartate O-methyltransferase
MTRDIDLLTSPALTHLRDRWWDASFTAFVRDTLRPRPGEHVLEVGCGAGIADLMLGLL